MPSCRLLRSKHVLGLRSMLSSCEHMQVSGPLFEAAVRGVDGPLLLESETSGLGAQRHNGGGPRLSDRHVALRELWPRRILGQRLRFRQVRRVARVWKMKSSPGLR